MSAPDAPPPAAAAGRAGFHLLAALAIAAVCAGVYSNTLHSSFLFDDLVNIVRNPFLRWRELSWENLYDAWHGGVNRRPVANVSFALNYYFGRYAVEGYHAVNILIHAANGLLVYGLVRAALARDAAVRPPSDRSAGGAAARDRAALLAALIFVAHPLQTQSVTYVVQRMNSMAALFYLTAFLLYLRGRSGSGAGRWLPWSAGLLSWILALGSKEVAVTLPFAICLYDWFFFQDLGRRSSASSRRALLAIAGGWSLACFAAYYVLVWGPDFGYATRDFAMRERLLTQPRVVAFYASQILYPHPDRLSLYHDFSLSRSLFDPIQTLLSLSALLALLVAAVGWAPRRRLASFALLWCYLHLALESSVLPLEMSYEHRTYLPMVGVALLVAVALRAVPERLRAGALAVGAVLVAVLGATAHVRNEAWRDAESMWVDVVAKTGHPRALVNLGVSRARSGKPDAALALFDEALRRNPRFADAHRNLGASMVQMGRPREALRRYMIAVRLEPDDHEALGGLGEAFASFDQLEEAAHFYTQSLSDYPDERIFYMLGSVRSRQGRIDEALHYYAWALKTDPEFAPARAGIGAVLADRGNLGQAIAQFREALRLKEHPETHAHLANALWARGDFEAAIDHLREARRLDPQSPIAANNLAWMLATCEVESLRAPEEAIALATGILRERAAPDAGVLDTLAAAHAAAGRFDAAVGLASSALALARETGDAELAGEILGRLDVYRAGEPFVDRPVRPGGPR